jgi:hypothetical protein
MTIQIHPELQSFFRALSTEELADLEALVLREGMTEPLYVWKGQNILLDGHHRYMLCQKHDLPYTTTEIEVENLDAAKLWMIKHQRGRRQWTDSEIAYYMGTRYELEKKQGQRRDLTCGQNVHKSEKTAQVIAQEHQVNEKSVRRRRFPESPGFSHGEVQVYSRCTAIISPGRCWTGEVYPVPDLGALPTSHAPPPFSGGSLVTPGRGDPRPALNLLFLCVPLV